VGHQDRTFAEIPHFDAPTTVTALRSRPVASFWSGASIWEIYWNGVGVKAGARIAINPASISDSRPLDANHASSRPL